MEKKPNISLKDKLTASIYKVLLDNHSERTDKLEKAIKKSVKRIVKKSTKPVKTEVE